jgi:hypothetical protein
VATVRERERLAMNKQRSHTFRMKVFNLKKLNELEGKEKYCVEVSNRFEALEDMYTEWKLIMLGKRLENIKNFSQKDCRLLRIEEA